MTVKETIRMMKHRLEPHYGPGETKAMIHLIFYHLKGWNFTDLIIHEADDVSDYISGKINEILGRLKNDEPIQYILGTAYFYGMDLEVNRSTLIPRPETEELVDMIVKRLGSEKDLRVLDIGTGSGAIAIALSRNLPFSKITAIDISEKALEMARKNARALNAPVDFILQDIFIYSPPPESFDLIVSNPPYIDESEKERMERNVLDYEPHTALFVPDENPLIYYSRIAEISGKALSPGGFLYFEINPRHCDELKALLKKEGFSDVDAVKDMHGKFRFVSARKGGES